MTPPGTAPEETVGAGEEQDRLRGRGPRMLEEGGAPKRGGGHKWTVELGKLATKDKVGRSGPGPETMLIHLSVPLN